MCTRPIKIRNNSKLRDGSTPSYYFVPCGHCPECLKKNRESYELRLYYDYLLSKKVWPSATQFFVTLTYNNENVPYYVDESGTRKYCCDFSDVQKCLKLLRKELNCAIRYFAVVEFGETRGRVHYHLVLTTENFFAESYISYLLVTKCWCKYSGRLNLGPRGFVLNEAIKRDGSRRKDYNCFRYVCKYILKSDLQGQKFTKSQSLRIRCSLGYGLGPTHINPFSYEQLSAGFITLPYSNTNRYYIPSIYYNTLTDSYSNLCKNARYVDYVESINSLIQSSFYDLVHEFTTEKEIRDEVSVFLHSKRFPLPEFIQIKRDRLIYSYRLLIDQIPNLYLSNFFKNYDSNFDYISACKDIHSKYCEDDLLDFMLYVLPFLDRSSNGFYQPTGCYVSDPSIYSDVVFLFNCLVLYIKYNQNINHSLSLHALAEDEKKSNYFNKLLYEQLNLSKAPESSRRELRPSKSRSKSNLLYRQQRAIRFAKDAAYLPSYCCPF